jgi:hypothetical protein
MFLLIVGLRIVRTFSQHQACVLRSLATFAPCLPSAVRVAADRWLIVFLRFADAAAFFTLRRAAVLCFSLAIAVLHGGN